jgi:hypothetical protein
VFIGDVMGHGTRSALLTSMIRTLISELYPQGRNPTHFLRELNQALLCDTAQGAAEPGSSRQRRTSRRTRPRASRPIQPGRASAAVPPAPQRRACGPAWRRTKPRGGALGVIAG